MDGEPLLTMRDGCAGFFTAEASSPPGKGIVPTPLDRQPRPGQSGPTTGRDLVPMAVESLLDDAQVDALRRGDLAGGVRPGASPDSPCATRSACPAAG